MFVIVLYFMQAKTRLQHELLRSCSHDGKMERRGHFSQFYNVVKGG